MEKLRPYTKAIVAFAVGCLQVASVIVMLNADGKLSAEDVNAVIGAVILAIGGTGAVYQLPNKKVTEAK